MSTSRRFSALAALLAFLLGIAAAVFLPADGALAKPGGSTQTCGDSKHPSGNDRCVESGGSGDQGNAQADPDDDTRGPERSNGGLDQNEGPARSTKSNAADRDSNNGCGNDQDFEDDNEGLCGDENETAAAKRAAKDRLAKKSGKTSRSAGKASGGSGKNNGGVAGAGGSEAALGLAPGGVGLAGTGGAVGPASSPLLAGSQPAALAGAPGSQSAGQAGTAGVAAQAPAPQLPATGANIGVQLLAALGSLGLGTTALRLGRRPAREEPWLVG